MIEIYNSEIKKINQLTMKLRKSIKIIFFRLIFNFFGQHIHVLSKYRLIVNQLKRHPSGYSHY